MPRNSRWALSVHVLTGEQRQTALSPLWLMVTHVLSKTQQQE